MGRSHFRERETNSLMKPQDHLLYVFFMWGRPADVDWQIEANSLAENVYIEKVTMHEHSDVERDVFAASAMLLLALGQLNAYKYAKSNMGLCSLLSPLFEQLTVLAYYDC